MKSPIQEQESITGLAARFLRYLYGNCRQRFHGALFVLLWGGWYLVLVGLMLFLISLLPWWQFVINYNRYGGMVGMAALGELVRGQMKVYLGASESEWCFQAMAVAGSVVGLTFWAYVALLWGLRAWYDPLIYGICGALFYPLMGWLFRLAAREHANKLLRK